jgi:predicted esterase
MYKNTFVTIAILLLPLVAVAQEHQVVSCNPADHVSTVQAGNECLAIKAFVGEGTKAVNAMLVFIHSDASSGSAVHYMFPYAQKFAEPGIVTAALLRPGYFAEGRRSTGSDGGRKDNYTAENIDAVAAGVRALKQHYKPARTVLIGHSGGGAIAAVILGRHPGLADAALLIGCQCNIPVVWPKSLSPHAVVRDIPKGTRVIAQTGTDDDITPWWLAKTYVDLLAKHGIAARFEEIPKGTHASSTLMTTEQFTKAVWELAGDGRGVK